MGFIKPPFFQSQPVASRGLGTPPPASNFRLRTLSVSINSQNANPDLFQTGHGWVDFVVPANFDNTSVDPMTITFVGGILADGPSPNSCDGEISMRLQTINGGSILTAPLSADKLGFQVGATYLDFLSGGPRRTFIINGFGLNQAGTIDFAGTKTNDSGALLQDGAAQGFPGDGMRHDVTFNPPIIGPMGWYPDLGYNGGVEIQNQKLNAGQTVTMQIDFFAESDDFAHPDRLVYGVIQTITVSYRGTDYDVPIRNVRVGWAVGGAVSPYPPGTFTVPPYAFNPRRVVVPIVPPIASPFQDFFLENAP